jgi:hypothetical protein
MGEAVVRRVASDGQRFRGQRRGGQHCQRYREDMNAAHVARIDAGRYLTCQATDISGGDSGADPSDTGVGRLSWAAGTAIYKVYRQCVYGAAEHTDCADNKVRGTFRQRFSRDADCDNEHEADRAQNAFGNRDSFHGPRPFLRFRRQRRVLVSPRGLFFVPDNGCCARERCSPRPRRSLRSPNLLRILSRRRRPST